MKARQIIPSLTPQPYSPRTERELFFTVLLTIHIRGQYTRVHGVFFLRRLNEGENLRILRFAFCIVRPERGNGRRKRNSPVSQKKRYDFLILLTYGFCQGSTAPAIVTPAVVHFLRVFLDASYHSLTGSSTAIHFLDKANQHAVIVEIASVAELRVGRIAGINDFFCFGCKKRKQTNGGNNQDFFISYAVRLFCVSEGRGAFTKALICLDVQDVPCSRVGGAGSHIRNQRGSGYHGAVTIPNG